MIPLLTHVPNPGDDTDRAPEDRPIPRRLLWHIVLLVLNLAGAVTARHYYLETRKIGAEVHKTIAEGCGVPPAQAAPIPKNSIFHAPPEGCPAGTTNLKGIFELKGKPVDGCRNPNGDGTIDILRPGEGLHWSAEVPIPTPQESSPKQERNKI